MTKKTQTQPRYCEPFLYLTLCLSVFRSFFLNTPDVHAHAWQGQEIVLFVSYDLSGEDLKATLGLPLDLVQTKHMPKAQRVNLDLNDLSEQILSDQQLKLLLIKLQENLPISVNQESYQPQVQKIDLVINYPNQAQDQNQRFIRQWQSKVGKSKAGNSTEIESHSGTQDALVISLIYPLKKPANLSEIHFFWKSQDWFIKSKRKQNSRHQLGKLKNLSTKEALGLIIDPQQITPLSFTPQEPEVIWRRAFTKQHLTTLSKYKSQRTTLNSRPSWWQRLKAYVSGTQTQNSVPQDLTLLFQKTHRAIYQAFDHEVDEEIYQALSQALHGSVLDQVFQATYDALVLKDEGGARAKVSHVIPLKIEQLEIADLSSRFSKKISDLQLTQVYVFKYQWRISGLVEHWGHSHRRVNDYHALYALAQVKEQLTQQDQKQQAQYKWKIVALEPLSQRRRPELEGGL